jgi:signal transduction histidine kinase
MINEQAMHLSEIVNDLLDVSRLEAGRGLDLNFELVDIGELLEEVVISFSEMTAECDIQLESVEKFPLVMGDSFRLAQVGRNLLSNAIRYSPQGGEIVIAGRVLSDHLEVRVQDQGIGMTPEQQHHLFEPFYRVDTTNTAIGGAGLGLAISKLVVEQHGGRIWLESEWGVGTTVYFSLPLAGG